MEAARADPHLRPGSVTYLEGDIRDLPVDGPFDAVVCWLNSFGYYDDADCHKVLEEFRRVLRPGGQVAARRAAATTAGCGTSPRRPMPWSCRTATTPCSRSRRSTPSPGACWSSAPPTGTGALRRASYFVRLPTPPEWVVWLEAAGFGDVRFHAGGGGRLENQPSRELVVQATERAEANAGVV